MAQAEEWKDIPEPTGWQDIAPPTAAPSSAEPNTVGTFASHAWKQLNPMGIVEGINQSFWHPIETAKGILSAQDRPRVKAMASFKSGDVVTGVRHTIDWLLPLIGPVLDEAADRSQRGEVAAGAGDATGLALAMFGPEAITQMRQSAAAGRLADKAEKASTTKMADVMSPKGAARATQRTAKQAEQIAPQVRAGTTAITPEGLHGQVTQNLAAAADKLDTAYGSIPATQSMPTGPILQRLRAARKALDVQGIKGAVTPSTKAQQAAAIEQAIDEVKGLGNLANTQNLAKLRNAWRTAAQDAFVPNVNPQFQQIRGTAQGWADAWSSLQDALVDRHPQLRPLNADYRVWKQASDVMEALADQTRAKPTVGRSMIARGVGAATGAAAGGWQTAALGAVVGPIVEEFITSTARPATKLIMARRLGDLATAIRSGQATRIETALKLVRPMAVSHAAAQTMPAVADTTAP